MTPSDSVNAELAHWDDVGIDPSECALLLGNGASMAVWKKFRYPSLYERAQSDDVPHPLGSEDIAIFESLKTVNFEEVLHALMITGRITQILEGDIGRIRERYDRVRQALIDAVCAVHIPWEMTAPRTLELLGDEVAKYNTIFSTNYDLLMYWSLMSRRKGAFTAVFVNLDPQAEEGSGAVLQVVARGGRSVAGQPAGSSLVKTAVRTTFGEVTLTFQTRSSTQKLVASSSCMGHSICMRMPKDEPGSVRTMDPETCSSSSVCQQAVEG